MYTPTLEEFRELAKQGNLVPVRRSFVADLETPVSALRKLSAGEEACYLLESVEGGERWGRYSFLGVGCHSLIRARDGRVEITKKGKTESRINNGNALEELKKHLAEVKPVAVEGLPRFAGGAVGYLSYDVARYFERLPHTNEDVLGTDDYIFGTTDVLVVFDNVTHEAQILANVDLRDHPSVERAYTAALDRIDEMVGRLRASIDYPPVGVKPDHPLEVTSNFTQEEFEQVVEKAKEYVRSGDIIQAVLSQRFATAEKVDPIDLYRALRMLNPSPYLFYLKFGETQLIGSSPEVMVRLEGDDITLRPIAGTRPRGATLQADLEFEEDLLADPKERAEHVMLVDLGRNDVGRVARVGTVHVDELMIIERYSHVMHIVSNVKGRLREGRDAFDLIAATFPAGTLSGAPKIRAMEIIEEFETSRRGPYGGAVGYIGYDGNMDLAITIRTFLLHEGMLSFQAGAGIVADSDPTKEYEETCNKAAALRRALELARGGLD
ncbi:MAG: anthranilate synthase component I [Chrysiogenetes bacterium]|nr:anthranilate synthase component I [Chrysiogenetes bacterium]